MNASPSPAPNTPSDSASEGLRLDSFLKLRGAVDTGGHAKFLIQNGDVKVNGVVETRRRRKLHNGDLIELGKDKFTVTEEI